MNVHSYAASKGFPFLSYPGVIVTEKNGREWFANACENGNGERRYFGHDGKRFRELTAEQLATVTHRFI